jgi:hypothetical protein
LVENTIKVNKYVSNESGEITTISRKIYLPSSQELGATNTNIQDTDYVFTNKLTDQAYVTRTCYSGQLTSSSNYGWYFDNVVIKNGKATV